MFDIDPIAFTINLFGTAIEFRWYAIILTTAMLIALFTLYYVAKKKKYSGDFILEVFLWVIPFAMIFARVGFVLFREEYYPLDSIDAIIKFFAIWDGGLTILSGIIGGALGMWIACHRHKIQVWSLFDMVIPALLIAQAIGRWGNFMNGELYGMEITNPSLQFFPFGVMIGETWHCANFFYESVINTIGFGLFLWMLTKPHKTGEVALLYIIWYGVLRGLLEFVKVDGQFLIFGVIRGAQLFSFVTAFVAFILYLLVHKGKIKIPNNKEYRINKGIATVVNDSLLDCPNYSEEIAEKFAIEMKTKKLL